ncbi:MAG: arylesterase [Gammaproteobacteria bacterium]|jgi:acyl-CoA thioesterase I|nr:arylesterase [Gammaproteobacteria bacterium]MBU0771874.1 arylesterase [Gammaproteobacteria bacterium]MBU0856105.1 arylesterase [Gammaproteobacteria bacterium]
MKKSMSGLFSLCVLFFAALPVQAQTLLVVGDSLSAGYGLRQHEAWPVLLGDRLTRAGYGYSVVNASTSGDTTANGRSRIDASLAAHKPAIVIIALGANDGLRGLSLKSMHDNLEAMTRTAQAAGARVLIAGMQLPPNYGPAYTQKFAATFSDVAEATRSALLPFLLDGFATDPQSFQQDGVHPVAAAQPRIVDNVWQALKPLLGKPR